MSYDDITKDSEKNIISFLEILRKNIPWWFYMFLSLPFVSIFASIIAMFFSIDISIYILAVSALILTWLGLLYVILKDIVILQYKNIKDSLG